MQWAIDADAQLDEDKQRYFTAKTLSSAFEYLQGSAAGLVDWLHRTRVNVRELPSTEDAAAVASKISASASHDAMKAASAAEECQAVYTNHTEGFAADAVPKWCHGKRLLENLYLIVLAPSITTAVQIAGRVRDAMRQLAADSNISEKARIDYNVSIGLISPSETEARTSLIPSWKRWFGTGVYGIKDKKKKLSMGARGSRVLWYELGKSGGLHTIGTSTKHRNQVMQWR